MSSRTSAEQGGGLVQNTCLFTSRTTDNQLAPADTRYVCLNGDYSARAAENDTRQTVRRDGILRNLFVYLSVAPGVGASYTITLRRNGIPTALQVIIAGANQAGNNTITQINVSRGDILTYSFVPNNNPAASYPTVAIEFVSGTENFVMLSGYCISNMPNNQTRYLPLTGNFSGDTVEGDVQQLLSRNGTFRNLYVHLGFAPPGVGASWTFTLRITPGGDTTLQVIITGALAVEGEDLIHAVNYNAGELCSISAVPANLPLANSAWWNIEFVPS